MNSIQKKLAGAQFKISSSIFDLNFLRPSFLLFILHMAFIKSRNWSQKEDDDLLTAVNQMRLQSEQLTWNQISCLLKESNPLTRKTGKQCRQRWANHLDPKIKRNEGWSSEENDILFRLQSEIGNKWSQISNQLPGRTDNCVKNHFYSTMRRGMRKINSYIENVKRKSTLSKTFKNEILSKILSLSEGKNDDKYQFNRKAKDLAVSIKQKIIRVSLEFSNVDEQNSDVKQEVLKEISEFSRNCRKRKCRKLSDQSDIESQQQKDVQKQKTKKDKSNNLNQFNFDNKINQCQSSFNKIVNNSQQLQADKINSSIHNFTKIKVVAVTQVSDDLSTKPSQLNHERLLNPGSILDSINKETSNCFELQGKYSNQRLESKDKVRHSLSLNEQSAEEGQKKLSLFRLSTNLLSPFQQNHKRDKIKKANSLPNGCQIEPQNNRLLNSPFSSFTFYMQPKFSSFYEQHEKKQDEHQQSTMTDLNSNEPQRKGFQLVKRPNEQKQ